SYGAFVDIGGVDGMVHVSEMSWSRIKHPSDVFAVGDEVEVYVIALDTEKKKISLGYKKQSDNPWTKFTENFHVDDICKATVVKLMPFGAFAEVMPGVDGLIHISQISNERINRPGEVLSEGQEVEVKITAIDLENKKISLSMRAVHEDANVSAREVAAATGEDEIVASVGDGETILPKDAE
ncbi:MAG: S1 RNA-binding domain-containing protein, partial [Clostridia bacterium]